ncbi:MAG: hypothetical protein ACPGYX_10135, partial [Oceanobacter sp.]
EARLAEHESVREAVVIAPEKEMEFDEIDLPGLVVQRHRHFDALLDSLEINIDQDGSTFSISVNGSNFSYNSEIDTSNIEIGGGTVTVDGGDGNWDLVISGNVTQNFAGSNMTTAIPETTITGVEGTPEVSDVESAFNNAYTDANDVNVTLLVDTASQKKFQVDATVTATSGGVTVNMQYELIYDYTLN